MRKCEIALQGLKVKKASVASGKNRVWGAIPGLLCSAATSKAAILAAGLGTADTSSSGRPATFESFVLASIVHT